MLANKPPMGWNSWNTFGENIDEKLIMETADTIVEQGYKDAGYEYVVIDDCWALRERDENGRMVPDPEKFPHGMKYIADYIHSKGLKFGMYSCAGVMTCARYPGSFGHEYVDAKTFAEWGVDYLKYDGCYIPRTAHCQNAYLTMSMALRSCGRDILFAACNGGAEDAWNWMRSVGAHMYRSTGDIFDNFTSFRDIVLSRLDKFSMSSPGCYNDLDMLIVGMYGKGNVGIKDGCTDNEYALHFMLWCMFGTPLMIGGDIRNMSDYCKTLLQNKELLKINQDPECRPPIALDSGFYQEGKVFFKILADNEYAIAFANFGDHPTGMTVILKDLGIPYESGMGLSMHNVVTGEDLGVIRDYYTAPVPARSCVVLKGKLVHA